MNNNNKDDHQIGLKSWDSGLKSTQITNLVTLDSTRKANT